MPTTKKRLLWLDSLRGLAMLLVLYGHLIPNQTIYFTFTSPVKIPLFLIISGYVFNKVKESPLSFLKKLFFGIILPWLCLSALYLLISCVFKGPSFLLAGAVSILTGEALWYMPCIIVGEIVYYFTQRHVSSLWQEGCICAICSFTGFLLASHATLDFFMINRGLHIQIFLFLGHLFRHYDEKADIHTAKSPAGAVLAALYLVLCCLSYFLLFPNQAFDIHKVSYYHFPYCLLLIIIGCHTLFLFAKRNMQPNRMLVFIGQNTLVYYILGGSCTKLSLKIAERFLNIPGLTVEGTYLTALIHLVIGCLMAAVFVIALGRFAPFAVGKKKG